MVEAASSSLVTQTKKREHRIAMLSFFGLSDSFGFANANTRANARGGRASGKRKRSGGAFSPRERTKQGAHEAQSAVQRDYAPAQGQRKFKLTILMFAEIRAFTLFFAQPTFVFVNIPSIENNRRLC